MPDVSKINQTEAILPDILEKKASNKKKENRKKPYHEAKKYLKELKKVVDETHKELEENNSPFRLSIHQEGDDIYIDVVTVDDNGKPSQVFKHDISHDQLEELVHHIKSGTGLILNTDA